MSTSYTELYQILEVFEDNPYQKIMMGAPVDNLDDVVIINSLKKSVHWDETFFESAKLSLKNILHSENLPESLILVTAYREGLALKPYLSQLKTDDTRYDLARTYLRTITSYEPLSTYLKTVLVDKNQVVMQDNELVINSLMVVDEKIESPVPFDAVLEKIKEALNMIFYESRQNPLSETEQRRATAFLGTLDANRNDYHCLSDIVVAFEKTFSSSSPSQEGIKTESNVAAPIVVGNFSQGEDISPDLKSSSQADDLNSEKIEDSLPPQEPPEKEIELDGLTVVNEIFDEHPSPKENKKRSSVLILLLVALAGVIAFAAISHFSNSTNDLLPKASFVRKTVEDRQHFENTSVAYGKDNEVVLSQWNLYAITDDGEKKLKTSEDTHLSWFIKNPGNYKVELAVKDKKGRWSAVSSQEFVYESDPLSDDTDIDSLVPTQEKLDTLSLHFDSDNVTSESVLHRSGNRSIRFDLDSGKGTFSIKDLDIGANTIFSAWAFAETTSPVSVTITGFNNGKKVFSGTINHRPQAEKVWEMIEMKIPGPKADMLSITLSGSGTVWIDDIDISTFK